MVKFTNKMLKYWVVLFCRCVGRQAVWASIVGGSSLEVWCAPNKDLWRIKKKEREKRGLDVYILPSHSLGWRESVLGGGKKVTKVLGRNGGGSKKDAFFSSSSVAFKVTAAIIFRPSSSRCFLAECRFNSQSLSLTPIPPPPHFSAPKKTRRIEIFALLNSFSPS